MSVFVIAEAGKNFLIEDDVKESLRRAIRLAHEAKRVGADCIKFQCHVAKDEVIKRDPSRKRWIEVNEHTTPFLTFWQPLAAYCKRIDISFLVTPMSKLAAQKIDPLVNGFKIASPDVLDQDLLDFVKETGKPVLLSSGFHLEEAQEEAVVFFDDQARMMHCVSEYPLPIERADMLQMHWRDGLSDHTMSLLTGAMAVALGAEVVEKHFTVDGWGVDADVSLEPEAMRQYIQNIREAEKAMIQIDRPTEVEKELIKKFVV